MEREVKNIGKSSNVSYTLLGNVNDTKICDMCGNRIDDGRFYPVRDEQFNIIDGVIQCEDCYKVELGF